MVIPRILPLFSRHRRSRIGGPKNRVAFSRFGETRFRLGAHRHSACVLTLRRVTKDRSPGSEIQPIIYILYNSRVPSRVQILKRVPSASGRRPIHVDMRLGICTLSRDRKLDTDHSRFCDLYVALTRVRGLQGPRCRGRMPALMGLPFGVGPSGVVSSKHVPVAPPDVSQL